MHGHLRQVNSVTALSAHCRFPQNRGGVGGCPLAAPLKEKTVSKTRECQQGHSARSCRLYITHLQGGTFLCKTTNLLTVSHNIPEGTRCPVARFPLFPGSVRMWPSGQVFGRLTSNVLTHVPNPLSLTESKTAAGKLREALQLQGSLSLGMLHGSVCCDC